MKKLLSIICGLLLFSGCQGQNKSDKNQKSMEKQSIYQFKVEDLSGNTFDFSTLKGQKIMIVNTASKCGLTPQYEILENLYQEYQSKGFVIVGFPAELLLNPVDGDQE